MEDRNSQLSEADLLGQERFKPEKPKTRKQKILKGLGIAAFILMNVAVLFFTGRSEFSGGHDKLPAGTIHPFSFVYFAGAILCVLLAIFCESLKYILMMRELKQKVSWKTAAWTMILGKYYDYITPSGAGGQPFQIWFLHKKGYPGAAPTAMTLTSFVTLQSGFALLALFVVIFKNHVADAVGIKIMAYLGIPTIMLVPAMIIITAVSPRISAAIVSFFVRLGAKLHLVKQPEKTILKIENALMDYSAQLIAMAANKILMAEMMLLSIVYQLVKCSLPYFVIRFFGGSVGFIQSLAVTVFVYASSIVVPTPGHAGAAEGAFYILFSDLEPVGLFWAMLVWRFLCFYLFLILGIGFYGLGTAKKIFRPRQTAQNSANPSAPEDETRPTEKAGNPAAAKNADQPSATAEIQPEEKNGN